MLIIGHRGAAGLARENSMEALQAGLDADADMLEFDIRLTKDRIPVLIHDATMRTSHGTSIISQLTFDELSERSSDMPLVLLSDVLDTFFGRILLNIELKGRSTGSVVVDLVKEYIKKPNDWDNVIFSSFKGAELSVVRRQSKRANLALLHNQNPFLFIAYHRRLRLTAVGFHRLYVNPFALEIAKRSGIFTYAYTVNRPHTAAILAEQGIDGIVTDNPLAILKEVDKLDS
ncbi:MAG: glycerophosphodiester phosphodiesterase [Candidatus Saccharimonadales bacterium]